MGKFLLSVLLSVSCLSQVCANTSLGGELYYKYVSSLKYEVTIVFYRDCQSAPFGTDLGLYSIQCSSFPKVFNRTATSTSITNVSEYCDTVVSCGTPNTRSNPGIEKHVYKDTLDLTQLSAAVLANCSGTIILSSNRASRTSSINTGPRGRLYLEAIIYLGAEPKNSSPIPDEIKNINVCCNQPVFTAFGSERIDQEDSISYTLIAPQTSATNTLAYNTADSQALQVFYPGSLKWPFKAINANPPIGFYFDEETAEMIFTPTSCIQVSPVTVKVTEWRKDSTGTPKVVGSFIRERTLSIGTCPDNNPPEIKGPYSYNVCLGDTLCFDVRTDDQQFIPPPPNPIKPPDSVSLKWFEDIPGASFEILQPAGRLQTGRFCWAPTENRISDNPYIITLEATDNACPKNAVTTRRIRIRVRPRPKANLTVAKKDCGWVALSTEIDSAAVTNPIYSWSVLNEHGTRIDDMHQVFFRSSKLSGSNQANDSLKINRPGTYILQLRLVDRDFICDKVYRDTLIINEKPYVKLGQDTIICPNVEFLATAVVGNKHDSLKYQWFENGIRMVNEDSFSITLPPRYRSEATAYVLQLTDTNGCTSVDGFNLFTFEEPRNQLDTVYKACPGDTVKLELPLYFKDILWSPNGDTTYSTFFTESNEVEVSFSDNAGCSYKDKSSIVFWDKPEVSLPDSVLACDSYTFNLTWDGFIRWNNSLISKSLEVTQTDDVTVVFIDNNNCISYDTSHVIIKRAPMPILVRIADTLFSNRQGKHRWFKDGVELQNQQGTRLEISKTGNYSAIFIDEFGCESAVSNEINYSASLRKVTEEAFKVYPNPSNGTFTISGSILNRKTISRITAIDQNGKLNYLAWKKDQQEIYIRSALPSGQYFLRVETSEGEQYTQSIFIE